jgi:Mlc titration factor MtfA (ptsG expression regulator)
MNVGEWLWVFLLALAVSAGAIIVWQSRQRRRLRGQPLSDRWRPAVEAVLSRYPGMPAGLRAELAGRVNEFVHEKQFVGCNGLQITDEIRATIATYACLLLLNRDVPTFPGVRSILAYPGAFVAEFQEYEDWLQHEVQEVRAGESWQGGPLILAWDEALADSRAGDERNVIVHEFAHKLDEENPTGPGLPELGDPHLRARWSEVMQREFAALQSAEAAGQATLLDPYGADSPAEFFAVVTETFFGAAAALRAEHPDLYATVREFFRVDPASWQKPD